MDQEGGQEAGQANLQVAGTEIYKKSAVSSYRWLMSHMIQTRLIFRLQSSKYCRAYNSNQTDFQITIQLFVYGRTAPTSLVCPATTQLPLEFSAGTPACSVNQVKKYISITRPSSKRIPVLQIESEFVKT